MHTHRSSSRPKLLALCLLAATFAASGCSHKPAQTPAQTPAQQSQSAAPQPAPQTPAPAAASSQPVQAQMRNVLFRFSTTAAAHIETLSGEFLPTPATPCPPSTTKTPST